MPRRARKSKRKRITYAVYEEWVTAREGRKTAIGVPGSAVWAEHLDFGNYFY